MHRASPNIYEGEIHEITATILTNLRRLANTTSHVAIYIVNGHGAWEAANANLFSRGDKALVVATGSFGHSWANAVRRMGVEVDILEFGKQRRADTEQIEHALRADKAHSIRAVLLTHVDTASTVRNDVAAVRAAIDAARHPALLAVDCIASLGCDPFFMDQWGVDVMVAASQKGLMVPPGLGFVWFSDKARAACAESDLRTPYWDWGPRAFADEYWQYFCGTAPTHHLYGLHESLKMVLDEEGLHNVWARHRQLAQVQFGPPRTPGPRGGHRSQCALGGSTWSVRYGATSR
jgi:alanine-glyoxylate transaminase/serine-glyoxylate transaminase/serine-pyruvate transaminase